MEKENLAPSTVTLYFDGKCPLCSGEVAYYRKLVKRYHFKVRWVDIIEDMSELEGDGISFEEAMRQIYARDQTGKLVVGIDAFILIWRKMTWFWRMIALITSLPLIHGLLTIAYSIFAKWRFKRRMISCQIKLL